MSYSLLFLINCSTAFGENKIENYADDCCKGNTGKLKLQVSGDGKGKPAAADADNQDHRSNGKVAGFAVIYAAFNNGAKAAGGDYSEEQHGNAAKDRRGDGLNERAEFSEKR